MENRSKNLILVVAVLVAVLQLVSIANAQINNYDYDDICSLPVDLGTCRAKVPRYYFNLRRKRCEIFYFGGCGGNPNNFKTMEDCDAICGFN